MKIRRILKDERNGARKQFDKCERVLKFFEDTAR